MLQQCPRAANRPARSIESSRSRVAPVAERRVRAFRCMRGSERKGASEIHAHRRRDHKSQWASRLRANKPWNKAAVALANKHARWAWAILSQAA